MIGAVVVSDGGTEVTEFGEELFELGDSLSDVGELLADGQAMRSVGGLEAFERGVQRTFHASNAIVGAS
jgi:hypothetical protein